MAGSPFAIRGVIEGFYGRPWTHEQRLELIDFMGQRDMNLFMYGPKDDPLVRRDWRLAYDGPARARLQQLVERCHARGMDLAWCISPGLSIRYSDEADLAALQAKVASVAELGVTTFALLLDDIPRTLQHAEDRSAFRDLVSAHVHVVRRVFAALAPGTRLIVCPTVYWGRGTEAYLADLADGIDQRIGIFWTGRAICSPTLDLADAEVFSRTTHRPVTYWDNYPVNDVAMTYELHIGPYRGRDPQLWRSADGIVANGMESFESSLIPIATIADYLRAPESTMPRRAGIGRSSTWSGRRTWMRSRCSRTMCAARACPRMMRRSLAGSSSRSCSGWTRVTGARPRATWRSRGPAAGGCGAPAAWPGRRTVP